MALLLATACASGTAQLQQDVSSLQAQVRTLQKENTDLARQVESLTTRLELVASRGRPGDGAVGTPPAAGKGAPGVDEAVVVPPNLKVVKLDPAPAKKPSAKAGSAPVKAAPKLPTSTPVVEPDSSTRAALGLPATGPAPEYPDSPAGKRARDGAPAVQGAAP